MNNMNWILRAAGLLQRPWVLLVAYTAGGMSVYLMLHHDNGIDEAAFLMGMFLSGLFVSKAGALMAQNDMVAGFGLFLCAVLVFLAALNFTNAATFTESPVKPMVTQFAGGIGTVLEAAVRRLNPAPAAVGQGG